MTDKFNIYLITGALGRIGRALANHLSTKWKANLVLSTRGDTNTEQETFRKSLEKYDNQYGDDYCGQALARS